MKFTIGVIAAVGVLVALILFSISNAPGTLSGVSEKMREPTHGGISSMDSSTEAPAPEVTEPVPEPTPAPVEEPAPKVEPVACTMEYAPVCGVDGITYGNKCMLDAQGTELDYEGECKAPEQIPTGMMPVAPKTVTVTIAEGASTAGCEENDQCYLPSSQTIIEGDTVEWKNTDTAAHTVTSGSLDAGPDGLFDSSLFMSGNSFSFTFDKEGTYPYFCMVHPWMTGKIIVEKKFSEVNVENPSIAVGEPNPSAPESSNETKTEPQIPKDVDTTPETVQESTTEPVSHEITIPRDASTPVCADDNTCFIPSSLEVKVGDSVTWKNDDTAAHFATSGDPNNGADNRFDSGMISPGSTFEFTFSDAGSYPYYCIVHPWMKGTITVS